MCSAICLNDFMFRNDVNLIQYCFLVENGELCLTGLRKQILKLDAPSIDDLSQSSYSDLLTSVSLE